jgi:hypothetical protein
LGGRERAVNAQLKEDSRGDFVPAVDAERRAKEKLKKGLPVK